MTPSRPSPLLSPRPFSILLVFVVASIGCDGSADSDSDAEVVDITNLSVNAVAIGRRDSFTDSLICYGRVVPGADATDGEVFFASQIATDVAGRLSEGEEARIRYNDQELSGRIVGLSEAPADATGRSIRIQLNELSENASNDLNGFKFGDVVEVIVDFERRASGFWVPLSALDRDDDGVWSVLVISRDSALAGGQALLTRQDVRLETVKSEKAFVDAALDDGTLIVSDGLNRVLDGQIVAIGNGIDAYEFDEQDGADQ